MSLAQKFSTLSDMGRPPNSETAPGVFRRGKTFWLRYSYAGQQIRVPLGTSDPAEANRRADELRGKPPKGQAGGTWEGELKRYLTARLDEGKHRLSTSEKVRYACTTFFGWTGCTSTAEVTHEIVMEFYNAHRSKRPDENKRKKGKGTKETKEAAFRNTATAQGYVTSVCAFLRWSGNKIKIGFPRESVPTKKMTVRRVKADELIASTPRYDLKFVMFAGFYAGMRKEEITMARPEWFDLTEDRISIPHIEESHGRFFETKSGRERQLPLESKFKEFLIENRQDWEGEKYMIHSEAKGKRYRWDCRQPLNTIFERAGLRKPRDKNLARFSKLKDREEADRKRAEVEAKLAKADKQWAGREEMSTHTMRHSYGSHHVRRGVPLARVALWMGDRVRTVESNYMHEDVADVEDTKQSEQMAKIMEGVERLQALVTGQTKTKHTPEEIKALARKFSKELADYLARGGKAPKLVL